MGRKTQNDCAVITHVGKGALWDSVAGRCVISYDCYNSISTKHKTDLFHSEIRIKAASGTFIRKHGECDITFRIGQEKFSFPFLCSEQLSQDMIWGLNFSKTFHIGTMWDENNIMFLTRECKSIAETLKTSYINAVVFCGYINVKYQR